VQRFILELREQHDATVLLTSHDMDEADALCDRLAILDKGRIVVEGTPLELKEAYARRHGLDTVPTLEEVFMEATGRSLSEDVDEEEETG
jgi:ABC-2 type transport system ATP-binding protein